ncbi:MAG: hypothetical protein AAFV43_14470 [Planctomycetota bacterium]
MPRLLILSPMFYPDPRVGAVRVTQWARVLPELGWETHALCRHYGHRATEQQLAEAVHPAVRVHYYGPEASARPPGGPAAQGSGGSLASGPGGWVRGLSGWGRSWLEQTVVPDVGLLSCRKHRDEAIRIARAIEPDVVLSSSPSHSIHWLGRRIADAVNAKWVADFRDPYLIDDRFQPTGWRRPLWHAHRRFERSIYAEADMTVHAIPLHGRWARVAFPGRKGEVRILPNGAPDEMAAMAQEAQAARQPEQRKSVRAVGYLAPEAPELLGSALSTLAAEGHELEFRHAGGVPATAAAVGAENRERLEFLGSVPHPEAIRLAAGADLLLAYLSEERSRCMGTSSKLFEYLVTGAPILVVNPTRTDRQLVRRLAGCEVLTNPSQAAFTAALRRLLSPSPDLPDERARLASRYNRRHQTAELAAWLDTLM